MTVLLQQAFEKASHLPEVDQDQLAKALLAEIESEERWNIAFDSSQDMLQRMGEKALADTQAGRGKKMGLDDL